jgi:Restriction endonuclease
MIPARLRFRVLQRDAFRCQYCGKSARDGAVLHLDHVVPVAAGGATTEDNLITACEICNLGKSATEVV